MRELLTNKELISIDQDRECRPPFLVNKDFVYVEHEDKENATEPLRRLDDQLFTFIKHLSDNEFVIAFYNLFEEESDITCIFADVGLPFSSGYGFSMKDIFTGEELGVKRDYFTAAVLGHDCRLYRCRLVNCNDGGN